MTNPTWQHGKSISIDQEFIEYCADRDLKPTTIADQRLADYDIWCSQAQVLMLAQQKVLTATEKSSLLKALKQCLTQLEQGQLALSEDIHSTVEGFVVAQLGIELGGKLHAGRSRNDLVLADMRLYMRTELLKLIEECIGLGEVFAAEARQHSKTLMPGFTHLQPAVITSWGHWLSAYLQALLRDLKRLKVAYHGLNLCPLGAAASYGTSWPIDRELLAELLGFEGLQVNTLDCISSRGEMEAEVGFAIATLFNHFSKIAQDLILFSHSYWGFFRFDTNHTTGSSVMPQKRNPDFAEVINAKAAVLNGLNSTLMNLTTAMITGYHRTMQSSKHLIMDIFDTAEKTPLILAKVFAKMEVNQQVMQERLEQDFVTATDLADLIARQTNLPFRSTYGIAARAVELAHPQRQISPENALQAATEAGLDGSKIAAALAELSDKERVLSWRQHSGSPAHEQVLKHVSAMEAELATVKDWHTRQTQFIKQCRHACNQAE